MYETKIISQSNFASFILLNKHILTHSNVEYLEVFKQSIIVFI